MSFLILLISLPFAHLGVDLLSVGASIGLSLSPVTHAAEATSPRAQHKILADHRMAILANFAEPMLVDGSAYCVLVPDAASDTSAKRSVRYGASWIKCPLPSGLGFPKGRYADCIGTVPGLVSPRDETAICRAVSAIDFFALNCERWRVSMAKRPSFKREVAPSPRNAHTDAPPTILRVSVMIGAFTAGDNAHVDDIQAALFERATFENILIRKSVEALQRTVGIPADFTGTGAVSNQFFAGRASSPLHASPPVRDLRLIQGEAKTRVVGVSGRIAKAAPIPQLFYYGETA